MPLHDTQQLSSDTMGSSFAYDLSGRLTQDFEGGAENVTISTNPALTQAWCPGVSPPVSASVICYGYGSRAKTYDSVNRLRSETFTYQHTTGRALRRTARRHPALRSTTVLGGRLRVRPAARHTSRRLWRHQPSDANNAAPPGSERDDGNVRPKTSDRRGGNSTKRRGRRARADHVGASEERSAIVC